MAQLNVKLSDEQIAALRRYAQRRRTPVTWLIKDYIAYLVAGGMPVSPTHYDIPSSMELSRLAQHGGAFDFLSDEPDLYSMNDGEPV